MPSDRRNNLCFLREELPIYHAAAVDFTAEHPAPAIDDEWRDGTFSKLCDTLCDFWKTQTLKLPNWSKAVDECALVMMSSGAVERVFSLYIAFFGDLRESVL